MAVYKKTIRFVFFKFFLWYNETHSKKVWRMYEKISVGVVCSFVGD